MGHASFSLLYYRHIYVLSLLQNEIFSYKPSDGEKMACWKVSDCARIIRRTIWIESIFPGHFSCTHYRRLFIYVSRRSEYI